LRHKREQINKKTIELAISILQSDKSDKTPELKKWALEDRNFCITDSPSSSRRRIEKITSAGWSRTQRPL